MNWFINTEFTCFLLLDAKHNQDCYKSHLCPDLQFYNGQHEVVVILSHLFTPDFSKKKKVREVDLSFQLFKVDLFFEYKVLLNVEVSIPSTEMLSFVLVIWVQLQQKHVLP